MCVCVCGWGAESESHIELQKPRNRKGSAGLVLLSPHCALQGQTVLES